MLKKNEKNDIISPIYEREVSMRIKYDVATLMKKVDLCYGYTFFVPVQVITGRYNKTEGYFETQSKESYYDIESFVTGFDMQEEFMCSYVMTGKSFSEKYGNYSNITDAFLQYKKDNSGFKLSYYDDDLNKIKLVEFDISSLEKLNNNEEKEYIEYKEESNNNVNLNLTSEEIEDIYNTLRKFIENNYKDENALDSLWVMLNKTAINYKDIMHRIEYIRKQEINDTKSIGYAFTDDFCTKEYLKGRYKEEVYTPEKETPKPTIQDKIEYYKRRKEIIEEIKSVIKGHGNKIDDFVVEIYRLKKQYGNKNRGILLTGSTGVGKSKLCSLVSEKLDIPCKVIDTTQLTIPGYKGRDINEFLEELYDSENGNLERVEQAVIIFDELDKKGSRENSDVSGKGVINQLLKFMDGTDYPIKDGTHNQPNEKRLISTKNMLVIVSGSFNSIYQNPKFKSNGLGFGIKKNSQTKSKEPIIEDFVELGGMPDEILGRFPIVIHLDSLTKESLKDILINSSESIILDKQKEFLGEANVELEFTDEALNLIAELAHNLKTGARGLQRIVEQATTKAFKEVTDNIGKYDRVVITENTILDNENFIATKEEAKKYTKGGLML